MLTYTERVREAAQRLRHAPDSAPHGPRLAPRSATSRGRALVTATGVFWCDVWDCLHGQPFSDRGC